MKNPKREWKENLKNSLNFWASLFMFARRLLRIFRDVINLHNIVKSDYEREEEFFLGNLKWCVAVVIEI